jgi:hypothetical protein
LPFTGSPLHASAERDHLLQARYPQPSYSRLNSDVGE